MDSNKTGKFIAECRKEKGMTQRELADILGVTNKAVSKWETGGGMPDLSMLAPLSEVLGISVDELINGRRAEKSRNFPKVIDRFRERNVQITKENIIGWLCVVFAFLGVAMQFLYKTIGQQHRLEYMTGWMAYLVNGICLMFIAGAVWIFMDETAKAKYVVLGILTLLYMLNMGAGFIANKDMKDIVSISPDYKKVMVLKQNLENGKVTTYRPGILWFVRRSDPFPYTADEEIKIQWLENDVCAITYISPDDNHVHQYVMTYGIRGDGITSPAVWQVLDGIWLPEEGNASGWWLKMMVDGVHLNTGNGEEVYTYSDCVQFGTLAMVLCRGGLPQWTVVLNQDCVMQEKNEIVKEGTISVCKVSMKKSAPMILSGGSPEYDGMYQVPLTDKEQGERLVNEMKSIVNDVGKLASFQSNSECFKIDTESTNPFEIGRILAEERQKIFAVNGVDVDVQITSMKVLAGDIYDFLLEVNTTELFRGAGSEAEPEKGSLSFQYRIMKADTSYLVARVGIGVDGAYGLEAPGMEQSLDTEYDEAYHFFVPGERRGE